MVPRSATWLPYPGRDGARTRHRRIFRLMKRLFVTADLGNLFLGGLLSVARADGIVRPEEMESLRSTALDLGLTMPAEEDLLLAAEVTADVLAAAVTAGAGAYRAGGSSPDEIAQAFLDAALRVAVADHELVIEEVAVLRELAAAIGAPTEQLAGWQAVGAYEDE
jgi:tellurite resistance protein